MWIGLPLPLAGPSERRLVSLVRTIVIDRGYPADTNWRTLVIPDRYPARSFKAAAV